LGTACCSGSSDLGNEPLLQQQQQQSLHLQLQQSAALVEFTCVIFCVVAVLLLFRK
jgi:hypothetical protein